MEYFLGSVITLLVAFVVNKNLNNTVNRKVDLKKTRISQSYIYSLIGMPMSYDNFHYKPLDTQATRDLRGKQSLVVMHEDAAYWIKDNSLFTAKVVNGNILKETTKTVDTMTPDKVELNKLIIIVDKLTEGQSDDGGNSGNKKLF